MPHFQRNGIAFHYSERGEQGTPLIFQHGLGGSMQQTLGIFQPPSDVRFLTFDFRGHGDTPVGNPGQLSFDTFADDVLAFMDHLKLDKAIVGGISMGAGVCLNFALRYPSRTLGLILSRPAWLDGPMPKNIRSLFREVAHLLRTRGSVEGKAIFERSDAFSDLAQTSPSAAKSFLGYFTGPRAVETAAKYERMPENSPSVDRRDWSKITVPTLILATAMDAVHPLEYGACYANHIPGAMFAELTPKSVSEAQHTRDVQRHLEAYLQRCFLQLP